MRLDCVSYGAPRSVWRCEITRDDGMEEHTVRRVTGADPDDVTLSPNRVQMEISGESCEVEGDTLVCDQSPSPRMGFNNRTGNEPSRLGN